MAKMVTPLTDMKIKMAKAKDKTYKLSDGGGLFLSVTKAGGKHWKLRYKIDGKEQTFSLGSYPGLSLLDAREASFKHKNTLREGGVPLSVKKKRKEALKKEALKKVHTFEALALERLEKVKHDISESHYKRTKGGFENDVFPFIGSKFIDDVTPRDIVNILQTMMLRGVRNSALKVHNSISKTFKYSIAHGKAERNPAGEFDVSEIVGTTKVSSYSTITDDEGVKNLLKDIKKYSGSYSVSQALLFLSYTFVRPSNVRLAEWNEIDFENKQWVIPFHKMKTRREFVVPLSESALSILKDMTKVTYSESYIFPSTKSKTTPLSDGALLGAIRRMGYETSEFSPHGFRAMFSTIAHEKSKYSHDVIETQLAHSVGSNVSQAYNRAKYLDERVSLMDWWAGYLDAL